MSDATPVDREVYLIGPYRLEVARRHLQHGGEPVPLTPKAFELLLFLVRNAERAVPRRELLETVWKETIVEPGNLDWNVSALRRALAELPDAIETVRGFGYRFAARVEVEREAPSEPAAPAARQERAPAGASAPAATRGARRAALALALLAAAALGALAVLLRTRAARAPAPRALPTVAVLPFENLAAAPEHAWLATALREIVSSELALGEGVNTVAGDAVARAIEARGIRGGAGVSLAGLAGLRADLGVDLVVAGTYLVVGPGPAVRVDLQLQDATDGERRLAWSQTGSTGDLLALLAQAGERLRAALPAPPATAAPPPPADLARAGYTRSPEALAHYAAGLERLRALDPLAGRRALERAVAVDPDFALAHGALAEALAALGELRLASAAAGRTAALARDLPRAARRELESAAAAGAGDWERALAGADELVRLFPASVDHGLRRAHLLRRAGRAREALAEVERLAALDAGRSDPRIELERGWALRATGDYRAALRSARRLAAHEGVAASAASSLAALALETSAQLGLGDYAAVLALCGRGEERAARAGLAGFEADFAADCGWAHSNRLESAAAKAGFERELALARRLGSPRHEADALRGLFFAEIAVGRIGAARALAERGLAVSRRSGNVNGELGALQNLVTCAKHRLDLERARSLAEENLAVARARGSPFRRANALEELVDVRLLRGDLDGAAALLPELLAANPEGPPVRRAVEAGQAGHVHLARGDPEAALAAVAGPFDEEGNELVADVRAAALARLGRSDEVERELGRLRRRRAAAEALGRCYFGLALGRVQLELGRRAEGRAALRALVADPLCAESALDLLLAELALERDAAAAGEAGARERLAALESRARAAKLGSVLGETL